MKNAKNIHVGSVYRDDVRPANIDDEVARICAEKLSQTHFTIGGVATRSDVTIGEMKQQIADIDPFGRHPDAIAGPFVDQNNHTFTPGPFISFWTPKEA